MGNMRDYSYGEWESVKKMGGSSWRKAKIVENMGGSS